MNSAALNLGALHHKALELWTNAIVQGNADFDLMECYSELAVQGLAQITEHYKQRVGVRPTRNEMEPYWQAVNLGEAMIRNYQEYWGSPIPGNFQVVSMEQTCVVPIPGTEHLCNACAGHGNLKGTICTACDGKGTTQHELEFTLDGLILDSRARMYVVERKTWGAHPNAHTLRHNDQFVGYLWGVQRLGLGVPIGIAYDGAWKRAAPATKGKNKGSMDALFYRDLFERSPYEVEQFEMRLRAEVTDMASDPLIYTNRRWEGCHDCAYSPMCDAIDLGEDVNRIRREMFTDRERTPAFVVHPAELAGEE